MQEVLSMQGDVSIMDATTPRCINLMQGVLSSGARVSVMQEVLGTQRSGSCKVPTHSMQGVLYP